MNKREGDAMYTGEGAPMEQVRELLFGSQFKDIDIRFSRHEERFQREIAEARDAFKKRLDSLENFVKSETASFLHRLQEEKAETQAALKTEQRERVEALKAEQRERIETIKAEQKERIEGLRVEQRERGEALKAEQRERVDAFAAEQRERAEALSQLAKDLATTAETFDRRLVKLSSSLDVAEQELRRLLLSESTSLSEKIEERYQDALAVLARTASEVRHDMVSRSSLSNMFTETSLKLSGQWAANVEHLLSGEQGDATQAKQVADLKHNAAGDA